MNDTDMAPRPAVGDGVTYCGAPGTVLRVTTNGRSFWFRMDAVEELPDGTARFVPDPRAWTYRAQLDREGNWRDDYGQALVRIGERRLGSGKQPADSPAPGSLAGLHSKVAGLATVLLKRRWYPMSYMGIPSVLKSADALLLELARFRATDAAEEKEAAALLERHARLRAAFRNWGG